MADAPFELPGAGEDAAWRRWRSFRDDGLRDYPNERNRPDHDGTSRLSPYLHLGVLHPRSLLAEIHTRRRTPPSWRGATSTPTCCGTRRPRRGRTSSPRWRG